MHDFLVVPIPRPVVGREVGKQVRMAVMIMVADLACRQIDEAASVPVIGPAGDVRPHRTARIKTGQRGDEVVALAVRLVFFSFLIIVHTDFPLRIS